jgi:hypothetical protein
MAERKRLHKVGVRLKGGNAQWSRGRLSRLFANLIYIGERPSVPVLIERDL